MTENQLLEGKVSAAGHRVFAVRVDVSDETSTEEMAATAAEHFGSVDILVNNSGLMAEVVELKEMVKHAIPFPFGEPEELNPGLLYLVSSGSDWVTGPHSEH